MGEFLDALKYMLWKYLDVQAFKPDPYGENHIGNWKINCIDVPCNLETLGGFKLSCTFSIWMEKVDPAEFQQRRMLDEGEAEQLARQYATTHVEPHHYKTGYFTYTFAGPAEYPACQRFFFCLGASGHPTAKFDPNASELNGNRNDIAATLNGCRLNLFMLKDKDVYAHIEENYAMLTEEQRQHALKDARYQHAEEVAVVAALKRMHDLEQYVSKALINTEYKNKHVRVKVTAANGAAVIEWWPNTAGRVKGFRQIDSLDLCGEVVIDHNHAGKIVENLVPGVALNYRVFVEGHEEEDLRFQVRLPSGEERQQLEQTLLDLDRVKYGGGSTQSARQAMLRKQILERMGSMADLARVKDELLAEAEAIRDEDDRKRYIENVCDAVADIEDSQPL